MSIIRRCALVSAILVGGTLTPAAGDTTVMSADHDVEPIGVFVWASAPPEAPVSRLLTVRVVIRNRRQSEPFRLGVIEISDLFLDGFELDSMKPAPGEIDHSLGRLTLSYGFEIQPQRSEAFIIVLRATKVGMFSGDIDVWSDDDDEWATRRLQTEIVVEPEK
jgi:hypothetical protein